MSSIVEPVEDVKNSQRVDDGLGKEGGAAGGKPAPATQRGADLPAQPYYGEGGKVGSYDEE